MREVAAVTRQRLATGLVLALVLAACGGGGGGGGGGDDGAGSDLPTEAEVAAGDERVSHPLAPGRYRVSWTAEPGCRPTIQITQDGGQFTWTKERPAIRIVVVDEIPGGNFFIEQTNAECEEWSIKLARIS
jgi:hypothetical protein